MTTQSEAALEAAFVARLEGLGWDRVAIPDEAALHANLREQLSRHNADALKSTPLTEAEFGRVLTHLAPGSVFEKAKRLRDRMALRRDDGTTVHVQFFNDVEWCRNRYQVTTQVGQEGTYRSRYDVTLLVNGLPLIHVELKRRGAALKEAFDQINRYQRHSFWSGKALFQYVQVFVISNGVDTRYFANNRDQSWKQTFPWAGPDNAAINRLDGFADAFLEKCFVSRIVARYVVLHETTKTLMVLRPYQFWAVERILERVAAGRRNGYIWHTTGSGKTLTSFKAAQAILDNPKVTRVVFVVDRADLDAQTVDEFNAFAPGSIDGTDDTHALVGQFADGRRLIVTTIQKLNNAITYQRHERVMQRVADDRIVFVFDECHRSQFGETHRNIVTFFPRAQLFGFTGTPILAENAMGHRTTATLFDECLHRYVITDAIRDENVLRFSVEYWGKLRRPDGTELPDEEVAGIDLKEFFESEERIGRVANWVTLNHARKTHDRRFSAIWCCGSIEALCRTYEALRARHEAGAHSLRVAAIFTPGVNEDDADANGLIGEPDVTGGPVTSATQHTRDRLAGYVADYNATFGTDHSVKDGRGFYAYYKELGKRMKSRDRKGFVPEQGIDVLLVVNMFLTGFDAKTVNTLYVDKRLRWHGLIQAFSRTNRILDARKSQGNVVCFRNLKPQVDEAITLFSNAQARDVVLVAPYDEQVGRFNEAVARLREIVAKPDDVDGLASEEDILAFVRAFRDLMRIHNVVVTFAEFDPDDLTMTEQRFEDFKSKYLDIHDRARDATDDDPKASIVGEVDFELELIRRDNINVAHILALLAEANAEDASPADREARRGAVLNLLDSEPRLRSKRELIEEFIESYLPASGDAAAVKDAFGAYWAERQAADVDAISAEEGLEPERFEALLSAYRFSGTRPLREDIVGAALKPPGILGRRTLADRVFRRMQDHLERFEDAIGYL
jgi:type I restriction enzyme R subunit